jgi:hypothetical protein
MALENAGFKLKSFKNVMNINVMNMGSTEAIKSAVETGLRHRLRFTVGHFERAEAGYAEWYAVAASASSSISLVWRKGPEPQGPASFRTFDLERAQLRASTPQKPSHPDNSGR